jgi:hypothetical protein
MESEELTPRPPFKRDVAALIGLLAVVEGKLKASETPRRRCGRGSATLINDS